MEPNPNFVFQEQDKNYVFQHQLTKILDRKMDNFNQDTINEIVLWKLNRYAVIDSDTLRLLNIISPEAQTIDEQLTRDILLGLFGKCSRGFRLPMSSTVLHFRNKFIYQIIDQRVFRLIYGGNEYREANDPHGKIEIYLKYLRDLRSVCKQIGIAFEQSSRWLYNTDKRVNADKPLKGYGTEKESTEK